MFDFLNTNKLFIVNTLLLLGFLGFTSLAQQQAENVQQEAAAPSMTASTSVSSPEPASTVSTQENVPVTSSNTSGNGSQTVQTTQTDITPPAPPAPQPSVRPSVRVRGGDDD